MLKKLHGWKLPLIAAFGLIFAFFTVLTRAEVPAREPVNPPPQSSYERTIAGIGVIEPRSELIAIGTELPGVVRQVHVKVGQLVSAGTPLFSIDSRDIDAQIAILQASLETAHVQVKDAAAQFALVEGVKDKRAIAQDDYNRRKYAAQLAEKRLSEIETQIQQAKTTKERLIVSAPIDGEILSIDIRPGEFATAAALVTPLIRMGDTSIMHVRVEIDEENAGFINPEARAKGLRRGDTITPIDLEFVRFEPFVRAKQNLAVAGQRVDTRVIQVIYALKNQNQLVFSGQQLDVFIDADRAQVQKP
ncbi:MAG: efflux RND transporter periplasmic adaptor subunit [Alphaproteobacteria bacterium]